MSSDKKGKEDSVSKDNKVDSFEAKVRPVVNKMLVATFLMTACNTMQSILYVPAALKVMGNPGGANRLMATLQTFSSLLDILAAPTMGALSDTFGRRMPLLGFALTMAISRVMMLGEQSIFTLSVSRIFGAFASGLFSTTMQASLLDVVKERPDLGAVYRAMDASVKGMAVIVGPYLAGVLGKRDIFSSRSLKKERLPYLASTFFAVAALIWTQTFVKETNKEGSDGRKPFKPKMKNLLGFLNLFGKSPEMNRFALMYVWFDVGSQTGPVFAVTSKTLFGYDIETVARWLLVYGFGMALAPGVISKYTVNKFGSRGALSFDIFFATLANFMMSISPFAGSATYWGALPFFWLALAGPSNNRTLAVRMGNHYAPEMGRGEFSGNLSSLTSISKMLSPQLHANGFAFLTSDRSPFYYAAFPFFLCMSSCGTYFAYLQTIGTKVFPWQKEELIEIAATKKKRDESKKQKEGKKG